MVDGKPSDFSLEDKSRRNKIIDLLRDWGLLTVMNPSLIEDPIASMHSIKIINHKEKKDWKLESKYNIGCKK